MAENLKIKESLRSVKILLVEDDNIITSLLRDVLNAMGFNQVTHAKDAERALQELALHQFDLILCDWRMGAMSGIAFTKQLRRMDDSNKKITPLIMITGMAEEENVREARDAGVTEYIIKPFRIQSLCDKIKAILEKPRSFVIAQKYTGPDRRRRQDPAPGGQDRRNRNV